MKKYSEILNESNLSLIKSDKKILVYFDLFDMLNKLEVERSGIKDRIWKWLDDPDIVFKPINNRILNMNLFFYGVGEEYPLKDEHYEEEVKHSKKIHPNAFIVGTEEYEIRLDLNLIWKVYEDDISDPENFSIMVEW